LREHRGGIRGIFLGELRVFWEENFKNHISLGEGELLTNLYDRFKGKWGEGITVGDLQHLVYALRCNGENYFTNGGNNSPLT